MVNIVNDLLRDLGILGQTPTTFPELLTWLATATIAAVLVAGTIKTLFVVCMEFRKGGRL